MNEILLNLAHLMLLNYCREHNINTSGTYCRKQCRGFSYLLWKNDPDDPHCPAIARVTFHKNKMPTFGW